MSIEIDGFDQRDRAAVDHASTLATAIAIEEGTLPGEAYTTGIRAASHAVETTLTALRHIGIIGQEVEIGEDDFKQALREIEDKTLPDGRMRANRIEAQEALDDQNLTGIKIGEQ